MKEVVKWVVLVIVAFLVMMTSGQIAYSLLGWSELASYVPGFVACGIVFFSYARKYLRES